MFREHLKDVTMRDLFENSINQIRTFLHEILENGCTGEGTLVEAVSVGAAVFCAPALSDLLTISCFPRTCGNKPYEFALHTYTIHDRRARVNP